MKIEPEPLARLMKETPGDKVEEAIVNDRTVDSLRVLAMLHSSQAVASSKGNQHDKREKGRRKEKEREKEDEVNRKRKVEKKGSL